MNTQNQAIVNDPYEYSLFQVGSTDQWRAIKDALQYELSAHTLDDFNDCDMVIHCGRLSLLIESIDNYLWSYDWDSSYDDCGDPTYGLLRETVWQNVIKTLQETIDDVLNIWEDCFADPNDEPNMFEKTRLLQSAYHDMFEDNDWTVYDLMRIVRD